MTTEKKLKSVRIAELESLGLKFVYELGCGGCYEKDTISITMNTIKRLSPPEWSQIIFEVKKRLGIN